MSSRNNKNMQYFLYINNNGREVKLDYTFNSLLDVDLATAKVDNPNNLFSDAPQFKDDSFLFIKDSRGKKYSVIYDNPFVVEYTKEKKRNSFNDETLRDLYKFLSKIKRYISSDKKGYLTDLGKQEDINKYLNKPCEDSNYKITNDDVRGLILPLEVIKEIDQYAYRKELVDRNTNEFDGALLKREFRTIDETRFIEKIVGNYNNLRSLIVWDQYYPIVMEKVEKRREYEEKQEERRQKEIKERLEKKENNESHQITWQEHLKEKEEKKQQRKEEGPRILKSGQVVFDGIHVDPRDLDYSDSKGRRK